MENVHQFHHIVNDHISVRQSNIIWCGFIWFLLIFPNTRRVFCSKLWARNHPCSETLHVTCPRECQHRLIFMEVDGFCFEGFKKIHVYLLHSKGPTTNVKYYANLTGHLRKSIKIKLPGKLKYFNGCCAGLSLLTIWSHFVYSSFGPILSSYVPWHRNPLGWDIMMERWDGFEDWMLLRHIYVQTDEYKQ